MNVRINRSPLFEPAGTYVFALQGFMNAMGVDGGQYVPELELLLNRAELDLQLHNNQDPGRTRPVMQPILIPEPDPAGAQEPNGYYPFSETGTMILGDPVLLDGVAGSVEGLIRLNVGGRGGSGQLFRGQYVFDVGGISPAFSGAITIQSTENPGIVWDYRYAQVSNNEMLMTAGARVPRPCVAMGTMRKIIFED